HLLVICAFRDSEVDVSHPLMTLGLAAEAGGVKTSEIAVRPLEEASVAEWLSPALSSSPDRVGPLSRALWDKTHGNPFFLEQLLRELHRQKLLYRDLGDGSWQWDQDAVERVWVTDNVAELMLRHVAELPTDTQELLGQAA